MPWPNCIPEACAAGFRRWKSPASCCAGCSTRLRSWAWSNCRPRSSPTVTCRWLYSARCFTARAENRPKDDCQFCCQQYPEGIPLLSQEGEALFTLNGIQTMSGKVSNLLADYRSLEHSGADLLRLSPRAQGMAEVIAAFDRVRKGAAPPLAVEGCNGYWHGRPGMLRAEEAGLC